MASIAAANAPQLALAASDTRTIFTVVNPYAPGTTDDDGNVIPPDANAAAGIDEPLLVYIGADDPAPVSIGPGAEWTVSYLSYRGLDIYVGAATAGHEFAVTES